MESSFIEVTKQFSEEDRQRAATLMTSALIGIETFILPSLGENRAGIAQSLERIRAFSTGEKIQRISENEVTFSGKRVDGKDERVEVENGGTVKWIVLTKYLGKAVERGLVFSGSNRKKTSLHWVSRELREVSDGNLQVEFSSGSMITADASIDVPVNELDSDGNYKEVQTTVVQLIQQL